MLQRVMAYSQESSANKTCTAQSYAYGITSDPLTSFAVVFCALIHDVDHTGVSNVQLIKENTPVAAFYKGKR